MGLAAGFLGPCFLLQPGNQADLPLHAGREDLGRDLADPVLLGAAIASLIAVGAMLFVAGGASRNLKYLKAGLALSPCSCPEPRRRCSS